MNSWSKITSLDAGRDIDAGTRGICYGDIRGHFFLIVVFFFIVVVPFVIMVVIMMVMSMGMIVSTTGVIMLGVLVYLGSLWILCSFRLGLCFSCFPLDFTCPFLVVYSLSNNVSNWNLMGGYDTNLMPSPRWAK